MLFSLLFNLLLLLLTTSSKNLCDLFYHHSKYWSGSSSAEIIIEVLQSSYGSSTEIILECNDKGINKLHICYCCIGKFISPCFVYLLWSYLLDDYSQLAEIDFVMNHQSLWIDLAFGHIYSDTSSVHVSNSESDILAGKLHQMGYLLH